MKKVANVKIHTMNEKEEIIKEIRALLDKLEKSEVKAKSAEENKTAATENGEDWRNNKPVKPPPRN